jgi:hypothetical protein
VHTAVSVTAIIPACRGLPFGVRALLSQDVEVHVLVLSNGSGPARVPDAEVIPVEWQGHGATRQAALEYVKTEHVFFTVDDAVCLGRRCLRTLVEALESGGWDGVMPRQVPQVDADAVTVDRLRRWTPGGHEVVERAQIDHVAALYRTETLRLHPLPSVPIAEDAWWSRDRRIGYVPMARVRHSHRREPGALYRRNRAIHAQLVAMGQDPSIGSLSALVQALPGVVRPTIKAGPSELGNQLAELIGQWQGSREARR